MPAWAGTALKLAKPLGKWLDKHVKLLGAYMAGKKAVTSDLEKQELERRNAELEAENASLKSRADMSDADRNERLRKIRKRRG